MGFDEYTPSQRRRMGAVYDTLARLLPTEGRDYDVSFSFDGKSESGVSVSFKPYTELGRIWCDYCTKVLRTGGVK